MTLLTSTKKWPIKSSYNHLLRIEVPTTVIWAWCLCVDLDTLILTSTAIQYIILINEKEKVMASTNVASLFPPFTSLFFIRHRLFADRSNGRSMTPWHATMIELALFFPLAPSERLTFQLPQYTKYWLWEHQLLMYTYWLILSKVKGRVSMSRGEIFFCCFLIAPVRHHSLIVTLRTKSHIQSRRHVLN